MMLVNPRLYEINTRVWIKQFGEHTTLSEIPFEVFENFAEMGIDIIWLMGIWKTCTNIIDKSCFSVDLISSYNKSLKDWKKEDVIGSPFSIDTYEINPSLGNRNDLLELRKKLNEVGLKLFLDYVPNHFGADSELIKTKPEIFLQADEELLEKDPHTFYRPLDNERCIFAHGRDPLFPAWTDTIQVNYFNEEARRFMTGVLLDLPEICDGVRCDVAMLPMNNVFNNTWVGVLNKYNYKKPQTEFWKDAIKNTKSKFPDFIFLGEAYWDLEWDLQQLGFDYTYDKRLADRLVVDDIIGVKGHLNANKLFQEKSVRFLENHDEPRAVAKFGKEKSLAAAVIISTLQGMKLYHDGQFDGKKIKLPVQLGREPEEKTSGRIKAFYENLLEITDNEIFRSGKWSMLEPFAAGQENNSFHNFFAWELELRGEKRIIVINYSASTSQCRLKFDINTKKQDIILNDLLNNESYIRSVNEIKTNGLFIELKSYHSHIFAIVY